MLQCIGKVRRSKNDCCILCKGVSPFGGRHLFAVFGARLPDKRRPEIKEILETYGMTEYDEFELLKRSGAKLPTDNYEFVK